MDFEEIALQAYLWRQKGVDGVLLCYRLRGMTPTGLEPGGSKHFTGDHAIDEALKDVSVSPSLIGYGKEAATVFGLTVSKLEDLGLDPFGLE